MASSLRRVSGLLRRSLFSEKAIDARRLGESSLMQTSAQPFRRFASGHGQDSVTYGGLTLHKPSKWHIYLANGFGGLMWFWIFYRFYHDYDTFLFGHAHHLERELQKMGDSEEHSEHS